MINGFEYSSLKIPKLNQSRFDPSKAFAGRDPERVRGLGLGLAVPDPVRVGTVNLGDLLHPLPLGGPPLLDALIHP